MERTEEELDGFVKAFEAGTLPKQAWTHAAHLTIGGFYIFTYNEEEALSRLRAGICHLNTCHGVENSDTGGYHESLTIFWLTIIGQFLGVYRSVYPGAERRDSIEAVVSVFQDRRDLFRNYWSFNVLTSVQARRSWMAPDLLPLD